MTKIQKKIYRRGFLTASLGLGLLPWLEPHRLAGAAPFANGRKLVVFYTPGPPIRSEFWKPTTGNSIDLANATLPAPIDQLNNYKQDIFMLGGKMRLDSGNHAGVSAVLTGHTSKGQDNNQVVGISLDQYLAGKIQENSLVLGAGSQLKQSRAKSRISYLGPSRPVTPIIDPLVAFREVFGSLGEPDANIEAARRLLEQRRSVLDQSATQLISLRKRLTGTEGTNLDYHLEEIRRLESKLSGENPISADCSFTRPGAIDMRSAKAKLPWAKLQMDIMIESLRCGARSVGVLQFGDGGQYFGRPDITEYGVTINKHEHADLQHNVDGELPDSIKLERVYYRMFGDFLDKMKAAKDAQGAPLLDSTVVLWVKSLGLRHGTREMFYMLAGGANSGITKLGKFEDPGDRYVNDLLVSLTDVMGHPIDQFGAPNMNNSPISL